MVSLHATRHSVDLTLYIPLEFQVCLLELFYLLLVIILVPFKHQVRIHLQVPCRLSHNVQNCFIFNLKKVIYKIIFRFFHKVQIVPSRDLKFRSVGFRSVPAQSAVFPHHFLISLHLSIGRRFLARLFFVLLHLHP